MTTKDEDKSQPAVQNAVTAEMGQLIRLVEAPVAEKKREKSPQLMNVPKKEKNDYNTLAELTSKYNFGNALGPSLNS